jgi:hypothetical protein
MAQTAGVPAADFYGGAVPAGARIKALVAHLSSHCAVPPGLGSAPTRTRCAAASVQDEVGLATKSALAAQMVTAAVDAGVPASWVAADEVYGGNRAFHEAQQDRAVGYVLAVACDELVTTAAGRIRVDALSARLPAGPGGGSRPDPVPRDPATTTGPSRRSTFKPATPRLGTTTCSSVATGPPVSWPTTAASLPGRCC